MRLRAAQREESPARLLEQLARIHQQTVQTADGTLIRGLTEIGMAQRVLLRALDLPTPAALDLTTTVPATALPPVERATRLPMTGLSRSPSRRAPEGTCRTPLAAHDTVAQALATT